MSIIMDTEDIAVGKLQEFAEFTGKRILEIGCGDGRMTFPLAQTARHFTAIDPRREDIQIAIQNTPAHLVEVINFIPVGIEDFDLPDGGPKYDLCLFTWSL